MPLNGLQSLCRVATGFLSRRLVGIQRFFDPDWYKSVSKNRCVLADMSPGSSRKSYPTDLSDAEWQQIAPLLPERKSSRGRRRVYSYREILNAIFYLLRTGCAWRMLPHDMPPWKIVYHYFRTWRQDGTWERIHDVLRRRLRVALGKGPEPTGAIVDSQSVKTTEKGAPRV